MEKKIELLAPGGDIDSIKAAIIGGADAVYCGLGNFNARNRTVNIIFRDLKEILPIAHQNSCKIFLTLNIIILESELPALIRLLNKLINITIDGVIVQDLGLFYLLSKYFKKFKVHASTQNNTHNKGQIDFLNKLGISRINLSRELNLDEIRSLTEAAHAKKIETEVFIHGSYCIGFSGMCYFSSASGKNSGNRGRCSQPCRDRYQKTPLGKEYPLNLKDNSAFFNLKELANAGVDSLKIEGRIKKSDYVYALTSSWRKQLQNFYEQQPLLGDDSELHKAYNRGFSNGYLQGKVGVDMYTDNPRSNTVNFFIKANKCSSEEAIQELIEKIYVERKQLIATVDEKIKNLELSKENKKKKQFIAAIELPSLKKETKKKINLSLSVLISSAQDLDDLQLEQESCPDIYFQLPEAMANQCSDLIELFLNNAKLIAWFPSILIGEDYQAAVNFIKKVRPQFIVTNNTGIAYQAYKNGIKWIAGPYLNSTNSYTLLAMKEILSCSGAFISNELSKEQIENIVCPDDFKLYYSIYHPTLLLTSKQCLFHTTVGCQKKTTDKECLTKCEKNCAITNMKDRSFIIDKQPGSYNSIYNNHNLLNLEITKDLPNMFSNFLIDLRDVKTQTNVRPSKTKIAQLFENYLKEAPTSIVDSTSKIKQQISPSNNVQYMRYLL